MFIVLEDDSSYHDPVYAHVQPYLEEAKGDSKKPKKGRRKHISASSDDDSEGESEGTATVQSSDSSDDEHSVSLHHLSLSMIAQ